MVTLLNLIHPEDSSDNDYVWNTYFKEAHRDFSLLPEWLYFQLKTSMYNARNPASQHQASIWWAPLTPFLYLAKMFWLESIQSLLFPPKPFPKFLNSSCCLLLKADWAIFFTISKMTLANEVLQIKGEDENTMIK